MKTLEVDFKDRDGKWILQFRMRGVLIHTRLGKLHNNMTQRCNLGKSAQKRDHGAYQGVFIADDFKDPQKFCDWAVEQVGWGFGYHLDKDLLVTGNKRYSTDRCVFLPSKINTGITNRQRKGRKLIGAFFCKGRGKHFSVIDVGEGKINLGYFSTAQSAHEAYCQHKEAYVKELADMYKDTIDPRAYEALMKWKVVPMEQETPQHTEIYVEEYGEISEDCVARVLQECQE